jgi:hypothetical protein
MSRSATGNILKDGREQSKRSKRSTSPRFEVGLPPIASTVWSEPDAEDFMKTIVPTAQNEWFNTTNV